MKLLPIEKRCQLIALELSGETLIGTASVLTALVGAVFTGLIGLRHTRREVATADVMELRSRRDAWEWAVRVIYRLLPRATDEEASEIKAELREHQDNIDNPQPAHKKESA
jgi:hypothetical protein